MEEPEGNDNYLGELAALMDVLRQAPPGGVVVIVFDATSPVHALLKFVRAGSREKQRYYGGEWLEELWRLIQRQRLVWFWWQTSHVGAPLNEWADLLADEAKALPAVAVSRGPVTFASLRWAGARGGVHEWASRRASEVTSGWLASFMSETPARGEGEIRLKALPPRVFVWADRVLSARAHAGDDKWRRRAGRLCRDADVRCPFGCSDEKGAIAFSWLHVHAFCKGCDEVVEARSRWSTLFQQVKGMLVAKGGSGSTAQMQLSERVVGAAADWESGAALPAVEEHAVAALREVARGRWWYPGRLRKAQSTGMWSTFVVGSSGCGGWEWGRYAPRSKTKFEVSACSGLTVALVAHLACSQHAVHNHRALSLIIARPRSQRLRFLKQRCRSSPPNTYQMPSRKA